MKIVRGRPYYCDQLGIDDPDGVIRAIYVGACIHEKDSWSVWEGASSHAHNHTQNEFYGWICILDPKDVLTPTGKMTAALAHEIAHLLCPNSLHGRKWKREITKMGYASEIVRCHLKPL
jgi:hypothetical protein